MGAGTADRAYESLQETKRTAPRGRRAQPCCRPEPVLCPEEVRPAVPGARVAGCALGQACQPPLRRLKSRGRGSVGPRPTARPASSQTPQAIQTPRAIQEVTRLPQGRHLAGTEPPRGPWEGAPEALFTGTQELGRGRGRETEMETRQDWHRVGWGGRGPPHRHQPGQRWGRRGLGVGVGQAPSVIPGGSQPPQLEEHRPHPHVPLFKIGHCSPWAPPTQAPWTCPGAALLGLAPQAERASRLAPHPPRAEGIANMGAAPVPGPTDYRGARRGWAHGLHPVGLGS